MNTLLDLMHQVWRRRTPFRPSSAASAAVSLLRGGAGGSKPQTAQSRSDLWAWYQSRCTDPGQEIPGR